MRKRIIVLVVLVVGCDGNGGSGTELSCPPRPSALQPKCSADSFCWSLPVSERPGTLDAITTAGCDYLLLDHQGGDPGTILQFGTEPTFGQIDPPVRPGRPYLDQLLAFSSTDLWAVNDTHPPGQAGTTDPSELLHYDGAQWHAFPFSNSDLLSMWASPPSDVWMVRADIQNPDGAGPGSKIDLQHWNGSGFVTVEPPDGFVPETGAALAADDLWICGGDTAYHFDSKRWTKHATGVASCVAMFTTQGRAFLLGDRSVLRWDGTAWSPMFSESDTTVKLSAMWGASADDLWVGGARTSALGASSGYLVHFDGAAWSPVAASGTGIHAIRGTGRDDVLFGGNSSYLTHWDGHAMTDLAGGLIAPLAFNEPQWQDVWGSGGTVWAVDFSGTVVTSAGDRWASSPVCLGNICGSRFAGSSPTDVWLVAGSSGSSVYHFDGSQWSSVSVAPGEFATFRGAFAASPSDVWLVGSKSTPTALVAAVFHFDGASWTDLDGPPVRELVGVWANGDDVWVTDGDALFHRQADQWLPIDTTGVGMLGARIFGRSSTDVYLASSQGLVRWDGAALTRIDTHPLTSVGGDATRVWITGDDGYLAIDDGTGFRTLDTGVSGSLAGAYFYAPAGAIDRAWVAGNQPVGHGPSPILEYRR